MPLASLSLPCTTLRPTYRARRVCESRDRAVRRRKSPAAAPDGPGPQAVLLPLPHTHRHEWVPSHCYP
jgi:hypothetical protein